VAEFLNFSMDRPKTLTEEAAALPVPMPIDGLGQALRPSLQLNVFIEMPARSPLLPVHRSAAAQQFSSSQFLFILSVC
jgi:hypothetical protein